ILQPQSAVDIMRSREVFVAGAGVAGKGIVAMLEGIGGRFKVVDDRAQNADLNTVEAIAAVSSTETAPALLITSPGCRPDSELLLAAQDAGVQVIWDIEAAWLADQAGAFGARAPGLRLPERTARPLRLRWPRPCCRQQVWPPYRSATSVRRRGSRWSPTSARTTSLPKSPASSCTGRPASPRTPACCSISRRITWIGMTPWRATPGISSAPFGDRAQWWRWTSNSSANSLTTTESLLW